MSTPNEPETPQPVVDRSQLPPFNVMAIIAFVGSFVIPVVGIVCGHIVLAEYRRGLPERGREYAMAGLILGYIFTALWAVFVIVFVVTLAVGHFGRDIPVGGPGFGGGRTFPLPTPRVTPYGN